ncbi:hypothetical protein QFZ67_000371 [Streptomyces sp. V1I1]|nr:hypothetical protein [Streptomyces sp. V1I1]
MAGEDAVHGRGGQPEDRADAGRSQLAGLPEFADTGFGLGCRAPPQEIPSYFAEFRRALTVDGTLLLAFFESEGGPVAAFDHKVAAAYRWPIDDLAGLAREAGFVEVGRMLREPREVLLGHEWPTTTVGYLTTAKGDPERASLESSRHAARRLSGET